MYDGSSKADENCGSAHHRGRRTADTVTLLNASRVWESLLFRKHPSRTDCDRRTTVNAAESRIEYGKNVLRNSRKIRHLFDFNARRAGIVINGSI